MTVGKLEGFVKIIGEKSTGKIIGAQIVGVEASDFISECSLALKCSLTLEQIASAVHPHPTFSESIMEAARIAIGKPVHGAVKTIRH
jgi:dihydrolipoamide dehydrogenase